MLMHVAFKKQAKMENKPQHRILEIHKILRAVKKARLSAAWVLFWEALWPRLLPIFALIGLFLTLSWLHLWPKMPDFLRLSILFLLGVGVLYYVWQLFLLSRPSIKEIDRRIEHASKLKNQPLLGQLDEMVLGNDAGVSGVLWREHRRRMLQNLENLQVGLPVVNTKARDTYGLRMIGILVFLSAFAFSFYDPIEPILDGFRSNQQREISKARLDAWIDPPAYTNVAPIFLKKSEISALALEKKQGFWARLLGSNVQHLEAENEEGESPIRVPSGSILVVRTSIPIKNMTLEDETNFIAEDEGDEAFDDGHDHVDEEDLAQFEIDSRDVPLVEGEEGEKGGEDEEDGFFDASIELAQDATIGLKIDGETLKKWQFEVVSDARPSIKMIEPPSVSNNGALVLKYAYEDDYGVSGARAEMTLLKELSPDARPLFDPPEFDLQLTQRSSKKGEAKTNQNLADHPWAGSQITLKLVATDDIGQDGASLPHEFKLPSRNFSNPLARAVIYERKRLALDARQADNVAAMIGVITEIAPEFIESTGAYLNLRVAKQNLRDFSGFDENLRKTVDLLWEIALGIEDGDLSLAQKKLREAQEELSKALENNADDEEIERLTQNLREAMKELLEALQQQNQKNQQGEQTANPNLDTLRQQDLMKMLDRIENLSKSGARDAARELLSQLQQMMDNLQTGQGEQQAGQDDEINQEMNRLGDIIKEQKKLLDETFQRQQNGDLPPQTKRESGKSNENGQNGQSQDGGENNDAKQEGGQEGRQEGERGPLNLQERQEALRKGLKALSDRLKALGLNPKQDFSDAGEAMERAEEGLQEGDGKSAVDNEAAALEALRKGAQEAMRQMQQMAGENGQGLQPGQSAGNKQNGKDPLGREGKEGSNLGEGVKVPDEIDTQRAREILNAIRKRLSDPSRALSERKYLERLLENLR